MTCTKVSNSLGGGRFCSACSNNGKVKSPIVLGGRVAPGQQTAVPHSQDGQTVPAGFELRSDGLYKLIARTRGDGYDPLYLCDPVEVVCRTRDRRGEDWGKLLRFKDPDGRLHEWIMPDALLANDRGEWRSHLLRLGLRISPAKTVTTHLRNFLFLVEVHRRATKVDQIGWCGDVFVTPAWVIPAEMPKRIVLDGQGEAEHYFAISGSLRDWQERVSALCIGNPLLLFGVSAAFAPVLLPLRPGLGGGFHFASNSSTGKSTTLIVAGSVWGGGGKQGFVRSWNSTPSGIEALAQCHNHTLLCLDELKELPAEQAGRIAYELANGHGRARMNGDTKRSRRATWELVFLSTGEFGYMTHILNVEGRGYAGQEVRVCEVPADRAKFGSFDDLHGTGDPAQFAQTVGQAARDNYGTAALAFVGRFRDIGRDQVRRRLDISMQSFRERNRSAGAAPEVERILDRFAFVAAAGELATEWDVTGWPKGAAMRGAETAYSHWLQRRGTPGSFDLQQALDHIRSTLLAHAPARLQRHRQGKPERDQRVNNRLGFAELDEKGEVIEYQFPDHLPAELCGLYGHELAVKALRSIGALVKESEGRNPKRTLPDLGRLRVWVIIPSKLFSSEEETRGDV